MELLSPATPHVVANQEMLRNREILVVDDNEMNRVLARTALEHFAANVTEAEDGQAAIDLVLARAFDLILLDIQMPVLDGYQTAQMLRQELRLSTPIIAFSVSALEEEREKCLAAGMNGYLSKPFFQQDFIGLVESLLDLGHETHHFPTTEPPAPKAETALGDPAFDLLYIQELGGDDADFSRKMVRAFINEATEACANLPAAQVRGDWPSVRAAAHKVKASLAMLNAHGLYALTVEIEYLASTEDAPALAVTVPRWKLGMSQLLEKVRALADTMGGGEA